MTNDIDNYIRDRLIDLRLQRDELLAALENVLAGKLEQSDVSGNGGYLTVSGDCMRQARAAIAKAKGA